MLPYPVILTITIVGLVVVSLVTYVVTETIFSVLAVLAVAALVAYLLDYFGVLSFRWKGKELDIQFMERVPAPHATQTVVPSILDNREVFHVDGSHPYSEASAVCAAYDAELATYDQIQEAYAKGAEWCAYGWSQGGMALFPTQSSTWQSIQSEPNRTICGRPGINGGYMDPKLSFGVNCYGVKPANAKHVHLPQPVPGAQSSTKGFQQLVNKFKSMIGRMDVAPFNRSTWSETASLAQAQRQLTKTADAAMVDAQLAYGELRKDLSL
jgi:hypothetical protein